MQNDTLFFANEMLKVIFGTNLRLDTFSEREMTEILNQKLFYKYKTAAELNDDQSSLNKFQRQSQICDACPDFSIKDFIDMEPDTLSKRIFMFENKNSGLVTKDNKRTAIQEALSKIGMFKGMEI